VQRRALVTGITGQDGSFLAELLLDRGYEVWGSVRRQADSRHPNLERVHGQVEFVTCDLARPEAIGPVLDACRPDEVYSLASSTFVPQSWEEPLETARVNALAVTTLLESVRASHPRTRVFSAASGEIFGDSPQTPQNEQTPCRPTTPYGIAKLHAHLTVGAYRTRYGMHASSGIAYNHESSRRPVQFVTRKITRGAAAVKLGLEAELVLGDRGAVRDWGYAPDYVEAMWLMLQQDRPDDYVIATGVGHTVGEFVQAAFACVGLDPATYVRSDPALVRSESRTAPVGDPSKARARLGWQPRTTFEEMVAGMVAADLQALTVASPAAEREHS